MSLYEAAFLYGDGTPSETRVGLPTTENDAAHRALRTANGLQHDTCVVVADTNEVVQIVRYHPK